MMVLAAALGGSGVVSCPYRRSRGRLSTPVREIEQGIGPDPGAMLGPEMSPDPGRATGSNAAMCSSA
jgi:hypothetical protein